MKIKDFLEKIGSDNYTKHEIYSEVLTLVAENGWRLDIPLKFIYELDSNNDRLMTEAAVSDIRYRINALSKKRLTTVV